MGGRRPHLVCAMERDAPGRPLQKLGANKPKRDYAGIEERRAEHKEPVAGTESAARKRKKVLRVSTLAAGLASAAIGFASSCS